MSYNYGKLFGKVYPTWEKINDEWQFIGWIGFEKSNVIEIISEDKIIIHAKYKRTDGVVTEYKFRKGKVDVI